jgi:hypothetical protein
MTAGRVTAWALVVLVVAGALGAAAYFVPRWLAATAEPPAPAEAPPPAATRHIKATIFYVSEDGLRLVPVQREVPFGDGVLEQARRIVEAQLEPAKAPMISAMPPGTTLRAVYVSERGEAYVDLSAEVASAHPGGALNELLTVYSIVNVLTTNLPAVTGVQILVDGHEVDTLAGHVDLRRPLAASTLMIQQAADAPTAQPGPAATPSSAPGAPPEKPVPTTNPIRD